MGTLNEPKIEAVQRALAAYAPHVRVEGAEVDSGVPEQPVGFEEISEGARNRAYAAYRSGACELAVGIEDGLVTLGEVDSAPFNVGCAVVTDGGRESVGLSSGFLYPPQCAQPALSDREPIGELFDRLWEKRGAAREALPSARSIGNVGKLTLGVLTRAEYAQHAVICALVRFLHPDLYFEAEGAQASEAPLPREPVKDQG